MQDANHNVLANWQDGAITSFQEGTLHTLEHKAAGLHSKTLVLNRSKERLCFLAKENLSKLRIYDLIKKDWKEVGLPSNEFIQMACSSKNDLFLIDKKGLLLKVNLDSLKLEQHQMEESNLSFNQN